MKMRSVLNGLIVGAIALVLYAFAGHDFVKFYLGGKSEMVASAMQINMQCNAQRACPTTLEQWQVRGTGGATLFKGNMLYFVTPGEGGAESEQGMGHQGFRLVYRFFMPDSWFEVQGGVGRQVTSGWKSRQDG